DGRVAAGMGARAGVPRPRQGQAGGEGAGKEGRPLVGGGSRRAREARPRRGARVVSARAPLGGVPALPGRPALLAVASALLLALAVAAPGPVLAAKNQA